MVKHPAVHVYQGLSLSSKKEQTIDESSGNYAAWKEKSQLQKVTYCMIPLSNVFEMTTC